MMQTQLVNKDNSVQSVSFYSVFVFYFVTHDTPSVWTFLPEFEDYCL